jgi:inorganic pyrophosphatase
VEIPAGTADKWEVAGDGRHLVVERVGGEPRRINYLPYPANYGFVPRTLSDSAVGGDGDPLDVVLLGPALPCGAVVEARLVGALRLVDDGEEDTKLLAVRPEDPLGGVRDIGDVERHFPGVLDILETWFVHYEGPGNRSLGTWSAEEARSAVDRAARTYKRSVGAE